MNDHKKRTARKLAIFAALCTGTSFAFGAGCIVEIISSLTATFF